MTVVQSEEGVSHVILWVMFASPCCHTSAVLCSVEETLPTYSAVRVGCCQKMRVQAKPPEDKRGSRNTQLVWQRYERLVQWSISLNCVSCADVSHVSLFQGMCPCVCVSVCVWRWQLRARCRGHHSSWGAAREVDTEVVLFGKCYCGTFQSGGPAKMWHTWYRNANLFILQ